MQRFLVTFLLASVSLAAPAFAAADRTLDCAGGAGPATAVLDFEQGTAVWSAKDPQTGQTLQTVLRLSMENGQYMLDTGHSIGRFDAAAGELTWYYRGRAFASASCRESIEAPGAAQAPAGE
jgi:hypothetical protein